MLNNIEYRIIDEELQIAIIEAKVLNDDKITDIKLRLKWNKPTSVSVKLNSGSWKEYSYNSKSNNKAPIKYKKLANTMLETIEE